MSIDITYLKNRVLPYKTTSKDALKEAVRKESFYKLIGDILSSINELVSTCVVSNFERAKRCSNFLTFSQGGTGSHLWLLKQFWYRITWIKPQGLKSVSHENRMLRGWSEKSLGWFRQKLECHSPRAGTLGIVELQCNPCEITVLSFIITEYWKKWLW